MRSFTEKYDIYYTFVSVKIISFDKDHLTQKRTKDRIKVISLAPNSLLSKCEAGVHLIMLRVIMITLTSG